MRDAPACAVALAVRQPGGDGVLGVLRPEDPGDPLAGVWGLPAASVGGPQRTPEALEEAVRHMAGRKLGLALTAVREVASGREERPGGALSMTLFETRSAGEPTLPDAASADGGATLYAAWRWMRMPDFLPAAKRGSLCTRLLLGIRPPPAADRP